MSIETIVESHLQPVENADTKMSELREGIKVEISFAQENGDLSTLALFAANGRAKEVMNLLIDQEWDMRNLPFVAMLSVCAKAGQAEAIIKKISANEWNFTVPTFLILLTACSVSGQTENIFQNIPREKWDMSSPYFLSLLESFAIYGYVDQVLQACVSITDVEISTPLMKVFAACAHKGKAREIHEKIKDYQLKIEDTATIGILQALATNGLALEVMSILRNKKWSLEGNFLTLVARCAENGEAESVLDQLAHVTLDFNNQHVLMLLMVCAEHGKFDAVSALAQIKITEQPTCLSTSLGRELLAYFYVHGAEWAKNLVEKQSNEKTVYFPHDIEFIEKQSATLEKNVKQNLKLTAVQLLGDEKAKPLISFIDGLSYQGLEFFTLAVKKHGLLGAPVLSSIERFSKRKAFAVSMGKTGSDLHIWYDKDKITNEQVYTFVNDMPRSSASVWQQMSDESIPVAPILDMHLEPGFTRVYSRYCGLSLFDMNRICDNNKLLFELELKKEEILSTIAHYSDMGVRVSHGHPHHGNFTLEFIKQDYCAQKIEEGLTLNTIPFDDDQFTFDPIVYMKNPNEWKLVVRLIDWDRAKFVHTV